MNRVLAFGAMMAAMGAFGAMPARAEGDATLGEAVFKQCAICHKIGAQPVLGGHMQVIGPDLSDVVGRIAGTEKGFKYSDAMQAAGAGGLIWTPQNLAIFLHGPSDFVNGTKMTFPGLTEQDDIDNVIAYLLTMSPSYLPAPPAVTSSPPPDASSSPPQ